jgi:hypothetical protein
MNRASSTNDAIPKNNAMPKNDVIPTSDVILSEAKDLLLPLTLPPLNNLPLNA